MEKKKKWQFIYALIAIFILVFFVLFLKKNKELSRNKVYRYNKEQALFVEVDTAMLKNLTTESVYAGSFEPYKETKLSAEIQGKINTFIVDVGDHVMKGQSLVQLDNSLLILQLQSIEVQIDGLEKDLKRYNILATADAIQGVQLEKTELGLKSAKIQKLTLQEQINKTTIKAPFDGIVTAKLAEEGAFAAPSVPLLQITTISKLKFTINVSEKDLIQFQLNTTCRIISDAYPEMLLSGKVTMIGSKANMGSSFPVQLTLINTPDMKIKSGMFGKVIMNNHSTQMGIVIPSSSLVNKDNKTQVYLVKNGKAILQDISILSRIQNNVVVGSGIKEGDIIIIKGFVNLFNGINVIVK